MRNKKILILSPQPWGTMHISKHHYAIELAKRGNEVFFLNPGEIGVSTSVSNEKGVFVISHRTPIFYKLKFHWNWAYHFLRAHTTRALLTKLKFKPNIVWSFDLGGDYSLRYFNAPIKIFHPVDEPLSPLALKSGKGATHLFSVTHEILEKYTELPVKRAFINHGVSELFLSKSDQIQPDASQSDLRFGYAGNLLRPDIDRDLMLALFETFPEVVFEIWGGLSDSKNNLGSESKSNRDFFGKISQFSNVLLHGPVSPSQLAEEFQRMSGFLICYDIKKDQSKGTNYHKILEYLSTGKVIVSNNVSTYRDSGLFPMCTSRENNDEFLEIFKDVIERIDHWNASDRQEVRIEYAKSHLYSNQVEKIATMIESPIS